MTTIKNTLQLKIPKVVGYVYEVVGLQRKYILIDKAHVEVEFV